MNSYLAKLVYRIVCGNGQHTAQFDEQVRIIIASNEQEAFEKGQQIGQQEEEAFVNQKQQLVKWVFIDVSELHSLDSLGDGAEVYSQIKEIDNGDDYCSFVRHKAALLQNQLTRFNLQTA
jgi:hypothetical protein